MADLDDIIGKKSIELEYVEVNGMCECYYPFDYAILDRKDKKVKSYCINGHETHFPIEILGKQDG